MSEIVLEVRGLSKRFTVHERGVTLTAFEDVSFDLRAGTFTALVAPSGSGKSSLLKCVYRAYLPGEGGIALHTAAGPVDLALAGEHEVLRLRRREMGFVTQFLHCLPRQSCTDVVARPLLPLGVPRAEARARAGEMLAALGLPPHLFALAPATFSGGEKQRVNLARGLLPGPRLLLLDEPTASLDADSAELAIRAIGNARRGGAAILAVLHNLALVERLADNVIELRAPTAAPTGE